MAKKGQHFVEIGTRLGKLVQVKNAAYGDAFAKSGDILRVLYPNGVRPEQYEDLLGVCRVLDKLFRIATQKDALGESPWGDVTGYGILGVARDAAAKAPAFSVSANLCTRCIDKKTGTIKPCSKHK